MNGLYLSKKFPYTRRDSRPGWHFPENNCPLQFIFVRQRFNSEILFDSDERNPLLLLFGHEGCFHFNLFAQKMIQNTSSF